MAVMIEGWGTTFGGVTGSPSTFSRAIGQEQALWTSWGGGNVFMAAPEPGIRNGERVLAGTGGSYRAAASSRTYCLAQTEVAGFAGNSTTFLQMHSGTGVVLGTLRSDGNGNITLGLITAGDVATANLGLSNAVYYKWQFAVGFTNPATIETRLNGLRVPALTTTDWVAAGGQPAGTLTPPAITASQARRVVIGTAATHHYYYLLQKFHTAVWTTNTTGATFALLSDFPVGDKKYWTYPNAAGNYPVNTGNWKDSAGGGGPIFPGVGTYPANIADSAAGMDSDGSYLRNQTAGTAVANDRISYKTTDLPTAASAVGWVQRTVWARYDATGTSSTIKPGLRSPSTATVPDTDFPNADDALGTTYTVGTSNAGSIWYPQMPYTIAGTTVWSPATLGNAAGGATPRVQPYVEQGTLT